MMKKNILAGLCILVLSSLFLAACSPQAAPPAEPTLDPNVIYTQAAQTVEAEIKLTEDARPTATVTATVEPTATIDPTMSSGLTATANAVTQPNAATPTATQVVLATPLVIPTATKAVVSAPPSTSAADKCEWVANSPADNSQLKKSASYDATIVVKNSGTTTWDTRYAMRFFAGERMGIPKDFYVQGSVKPGEMYKFIFPITMPDSTGKKEALIVVQNPDGANMCFINLPIEVVNE